jgi:TatD DNase family protein
MTTMDQSDSFPIGALVDAHCHLDLYENPEQVIAETESRQTFTLAVTNAPSVYFHTARLTAKCRYVRPALGLHPELVHSHGHEVQQIPDLLKTTRYVGEIGLDYQTSDLDQRQAQRKVLTSILKWCADHGDKILTLHSRRAAADVISCLGEAFPGKAILHWFSGSARELDCAVTNGLYFSVNPSMVRSEKGRALVLRMPAERVLTETDGPFVKAGGRVARPKDVLEVIEQLGIIWSLPTENASERVLQNLRSLLQR